MTLRVLHHCSCAERESISAPRLRPRHSRDHQRASAGTLSAICSLLRPFHSLLGASRPLSVNGREKERSDQIRTRGITTRAQRQSAASTLIFGSPQPSDHTVAHRLPTHAPLAAKLTPDPRLLACPLPQVSVMTGHWEVTTDRIDNSHHVSIGEGAFGMIYEGRVKVRRTARAAQAGRGKKL